jgi:hypothetical protein
MQRRFFMSQQRRINCGSCLLAVLAFAALPANSALAGYRSHSVHSAALHHHSRAASRSVETSRISTVTPRDSSSETKGAAADQSKGGSAKDGARLTGIDKGIRLWTRGLQIWSPKFAKVSGQVREYSRFAETIARDRVRSRHCRPRIALLFRAPFGPRTKVCQAKAGLLLARVCQ